MMDRVEICWQGERALIVDKPAGWLSVPGRTQDDARQCVGTWLQDALGVRLWPVHRLDSAVSGALIFAKDADAHRALNAAFEARKIHKRYEAWADAQVAASWEVGQAARWESMLSKGKKRAYVDPERGKPSTTLARFMGRLEAYDAARFELSPVTGRSHQLRVHMVEHVGPILNDALYSGVTRWPQLQDFIALRAVGLELSELDASLGLPSAFEVAPLEAHLQQLLSRDA